MQVEQRRSELLLVQLNLENALTSTPAPATPTPPRAPAPVAAAPDSTTVSAGAIVGIVIFGLVIITAMIACLAVLRIRRTPPYRADGGSPKLSLPELHHPAAPAAAADERHASFEEAHYDAAPWPDDDHYHRPPGSQSDPTSQPRRAPGGDSFYDSRYHPRGDDPTLRYYHPQHHHATTGAGRGRSASERHQGFHDDPLLAADAAHGGYGRRY